MIDAIYNAGLNLLSYGWWTAIVWPVLWILLKIVVILAPLMGAVAYLTLWERKLLGFMQVRHGPNRVGPMGLLQPIADALKLLTKEIIQPTAASKGLFVLGPGHGDHAGAWRPGLRFLLARCGAGQCQRRPLLLVMAITSIEVYGVIIAGWASNSKYAFLGACVLRRRW
jgi:NADH-quinone oxidoreductase subunit H